GGVGCAVTAGRSGIHGRRGQDNALRKSERGTRGAARSARRARARRCVLSRLESFCRWKRTENSTRQLFVSRRGSRRRSASRRVRLRSPLVQDRLDHLCIDGRPAHFVLACQCGLAEKRLPANGPLAVGKSCPDGAALSRSPRGSMRQAARLAGGLRAKTETSGTPASSTPRNGRIGASNSARSRGPSTLRRLSRT